MIVVTRLNGSRFAVNPDLIERIHASPDTTLILVDGTSFIVSESLETVVEAIVAYRARVISAAHVAIDRETPTATATRATDAVVSPITAAATGAR